MLRQLVRLAGRVRLPPTPSLRRFSAASSAMGYRGGGGGGGGGGGYRGRPPPRGRIQPRRRGGGGGPAVPQLGRDVDPDLDGVDIDTDDEDLAEELLAVRDEYRRRFAKNHEISAKEVRVIDADGSQLGVMPLEQAFEMKQEAQLDLICVAPEEAPPVCRLASYAEFVGSKLAKAEESYRKMERESSEVEYVKELRVGSKIGEHDFEVKMKQLNRLLDRGTPVRVTAIHKLKRRPDEFERLKLEREGKRWRPPTREEVKAATHKAQKKLLKRVVGAIDAKVNSIDKTNYDFVILHRPEMAKERAPKKRPRRS